VNMTIHFLLFDKVKNLWRYTSIPTLLQGVLLSQAQGQVYLNLTFPIFLKSRPFNVIRKNLQCLNTLCQRQLKSFVKQMRNQ